MDDLIVVERDRGMEETEGIRVGQRQFLDHPLTVDTARPDPFLKRLAKVSRSLKVDVPEKITDSRLSCKRTQPPTG
jgi:hypothetical protein